MKNLDYFQVCEAVDAFTGDHKGDFDTVALIDVLFERLPSHPEYVTLFVEREYTDEEVLACDVTAWQTCKVPTDSGETMLAERWFHSPEHGPVHVGAWQDASGAISLSLAAVEYGGLSPWNGRGAFIGDTLKPETWGAFDRAYGGRENWWRDLETAAAIISHN